MLIKLASGDVGMVSLMCAPVDLINQCTVTWNVSIWSLYSYMHTYVCVLYLHNGLT